ncbi:MAG: hypothetical protein ACREBC_38995 [Pyrinomonadaceae bacterium]
MMDLDDESHTLATLARYLPEALQINLNQEFAQDVLIDNALDRVSSASGAVYLRDNKEDQNGAGASGNPTVDDYPAILHEKKRTPCHTNSPLHRLSNRLTK